MKYVYPLKTNLRMKKINKIRVLIIDDHKMIRDGLRVMLEMQQDKYLFSIDEAASGEEGVEMAKQKAYDIILMDYQLTGMSGAEAAQAIMERKPNSKILALSNYNEYVYINKMVNEAKVHGYILKNVGPEELIRAIESIIGNKHYYSNEVALNLLSNGVRDPNYTRLRNKEAVEVLLSKREKQILKLIGDEYTNEEIAEKLSIGKRTVETHRQNIMFKLNVKNSVGLVKVAFEVLAQKA